MKDPLEGKGRPWQVFQLTPRVLWAIAGGVFATLLAVGTQLMLGKTFDYVLAHQGAGGKVTSYFVLLAVLTLASVAASTVFTDYLPIRVNILRARDVQCHCLWRILRMALQPYGRRDQGFFFNIMTGSAPAMGDIYYQMSVQMISCSLSFALLLGLAWWLSPYLALALLCYIPVAALIVLAPTKAIAKVQEVAFPKQDEYLRRLKATIDKKKVITINGAEEAFYAKNEKAIDRWIHFVSRLQFFRVVEYNLPGIMSSLFQLVLLAVSVRLYLREALTLGQVFVAWQLAGLVQMPLAQLFNNLSHYRVTRPHIERMKEFCALADEPTGFEDLYGPVSGLALVEGGRFFPTAEKERLLFETDTAFELPERGLVVLKGANGTGKSMLVNFLTGYGDSRAFEGKAALSSALKDVAYLTYPLLLTDGSVEENLFGKGYDPTVAQVLGIDFFDKIIDDEKINLSFGEQQKLNLLRVLSSPAPVVVLDEPFTNLDRETIARLTGYLAGLRGQRAVIVITHSPELDAFADAIYHIKDQRLIREK